jgi:hypothetical protein
MKHPRSAFGALKGAPLAARQSRIRGDHLIASTPSIGSQMNCR